MLRWKESAKCELDIGAEIVKEELWWVPPAILAHLRSAPP
jgi:hypothetical protein